MCVSGVAFVRSLYCGVSVAVQQFYNLREEAVHNMSGRFSFELFCILITLIKQTKKKIVCVEFI